MTTTREARGGCTKEYKVVALRDCALTDPMTVPLLDNPAAAARYWTESIATAPWHRSDVEQLVVVLLNTRRRVIGHVVVGLGTVDSVLAHPREVFRAAIVANAAAIILMHNHPSGESSPSEADIKMTREIYRAGQLLRIEVLDHVIMGHKPTSLKELGYFYN